MHAFLVLLSQPFVLLIFQKLISCLCIQTALMVGFAYVIQSYVPACFLMISSIDNMDLNLIFALIFMY